MRERTRSARPVASSDAGVKAEYVALVQGAASGDRDAMERLLVRAQEAAYRFSLLVCGRREDAEDVMQDALVNTYRHVRRIRAPEAFRTWLYQTVRRACLMKRRRRVGEPVAFVSLDQTADGAGEAPRGVEVADPSRLPDERVFDRWMGRRLRAALRRLSPASRMLIVMREIEGLSTREVASITGLSEANVKTRLHRARLQLRRQLEGP